MKTKPKKMPKKTHKPGLRGPIWQTEYRVIILSDEQVSPQADIRDVIQEATDGAYIGDVDIVRQRTVDPRWVRRKLKAIDNDGTFFDTEDDDDAT